MANKPKTGYLVYVHNEHQYKQLLRFKSTLAVARHRLAVVDCVGDLVNRKQFTVLDLPWADLEDNKNYTAYYITPFEQTILINPGFVLQQELMYVDYASVRYVDISTVPNKPPRMHDVCMSLDLFMFNKSQTSAQFFHLLDEIRTHWKDCKNDIGLNRYEYFDPDHSAEWIANYMELPVTNMLAYRMEEFATHSGVHPIRGLQNVSMV